MRAAVAALPPERPAFPVAPAYRVRPDLKRLEPGEGHFRHDAAYPDFVRAKLARLARPERCRVLAPGLAPEALRPALEEVAARLAEERPDALHRDGDACRLPLLAALEPALAERAHAHLAALPPALRLADALALAVQEDLVLLRGPPGEDRAELLHVCLPSHWSPGARAGASFAELHGPVPHGAALQAAARNLVAAMLAKGPFVRHVWSLPPRPDLALDPAEAPPAPDLRGVRGEALLARLWLRAERQTSRALPASGRALFTIRVSMQPLPAALAGEPERAARLATAVRSMDDALLAYKSLGGIRAPLLAALDARAQGEGTSPPAAP